MKKRIGIQGFLVFSSFIIAVLFPKIFFPTGKEAILRRALCIVGIAMILFGFLIRITARGRKADESDSGRSLVTNGPYALMMHPMYFGTLLIGIGVVLALFNLWVLPIFLIGYSLIYARQMRKEEGLLSARFGAAYAEYSKKTPKYFPAISSISKSDAKRFLLLKWAWVKKELPSIIALFSAMVAIKILVR